jgi:hypothetical protein
MGGMESRRYVDQEWCMCSIYISSSFVIQNIVLAMQTLLGPGILRTGDPCNPFLIVHAPLGAP